MEIHWKVPGRRKHSRVRREIVWSRPQGAPARDARLEDRLVWSAAE